MESTGRVTLNAPYDLHFYEKMACVEAPARTYLTREFAKLVLTNVQGPHWLIMRAAETECRDARLFT